MFAYVGCYTTPDRDGRGEGIAAYRMNPGTGDWALIQVLRGLPNPSFLALDSGHRHLYSVHGGDDFSEVSAFAIDRTNGQLAPLGSQPSGGANPVGLVVDSTDRFLVVANYAAGTVGLLPINRDGSLAPLCDLATLTGEPGPDPIEQAGPHPHHVAFDPAGNFVVVPDKGLDRVFVFGLDRDAGRLTPAEVPSVVARPGAAPRHVAFHPSRPRAYVINERDSTLTTYAFDAARGDLEPLQVISTLPPDFDGRNTTAEIAVSPSGAVVYGSNRGHDSIAIFGIEAESSTLRPIGWEPTQGRTPRFFGLDPGGTWLYAANQDTDTIVTFRVDPESGALAATGQVIRTGSPVCIVFARD